MKKKKEELVSNKQTIINSSIFKVFLINTKQSFTRFFFVYLSMVFTTIFSILNSHEIIESSEEFLFGLYLVIVLFLAIKLLVETKGFSFVFHLFFMLLGLAIIFGSQEVFFSSMGFLSIGVLVFLMLSSFLFSDNNKAFLEFNLNLSFIALFALIASTIFYLGIFGIIESMVYLFGLELWNNIHLDIAIIVFTLIFPTIIISNISKPLLKSFVKPIEILIKYILTPLLLVYLVILYAYFIKVGIVQELPKGSIANMVSYYGLIGVFTFMLIGAIENKNRVLELFEKYFFYTLIIPLGFLYFAIFMRIKQYGFTESRYAVVLIALWLSLLVVYFFIKKNKILFKNLFLFLSVFLFIAYATPFSATKISVDSQINRFINFLNKHKLLKEGQVIALNKELSLDERIDITSIAQYLQSNERALQKLEPYFKNLRQKQNMEEFRWKLLELLNIEPAYNSMKELSFKEYKVYNFSLSMPRVLKNSYISYVNLYKEDKYELFYFSKEGIKKDIKVFIQKNHLIVYLDKKNIVFDILKPLKHYKEDSITKSFILEKNNIVLKIENLELRKKKITSMSFYLIIKN